VALILTLEGAAIGAAGSAIGTLLGLQASRFLLEHAGGDLGAGFFTASQSPFTPDVPALAFIAALGIGMSVAGALWVARAVGRIEVAEALRDRAVDLPRAAGGGGFYALALVLLGIPSSSCRPSRDCRSAGMARSRCGCAPPCSRWGRFAARSSRARPRRARPSRRSRSRRCATFPAISRRASPASW
jgi:hypothetical protein